MRKINLIVSSFIFVCGINASFAAQKLSITDVTSHVKKENYLVLEKAARVYQAKEQINVARGSLLPSLNVWKLAKLITGIANPAGLVEMIPDIAPFIVPNNWFRLEQANVLYDSEKEAYRALWANEIMTARSLYLKVLMDQDLHDVVAKNSKDLAELLEIAKTKEQVGLITPGTSKGIEIQMLAFREDQRNLDLLIRSEVSQLAYSAGLPVYEQIQTVKVKFPDLSKAQPLNYFKLLPGAVGNSPEVKQLEHILRVIPSIRKESYFSFLGASNVSRGVAGGIFDDLPVNDGLGFGTGPTIRIVNSELYVFQIRKLGVEETVRRQLLLAVDGHNVNLDSYPDLSKRLSLAEEQISLMRTRLQMGQQVDLPDLMLAMNTRSVSQALLLELRYKFMINQDKVARLLFEGDYVAKN